FLPGFSAATSEPSTAPPAFLWGPDLITSNHHTALKASCALVGPGSKPHVARARSQPAGSLWSGRLFFGLTVRTYPGVPFRAGCPRFRFSLCVEPGDVTER